MPRIGPTELIIILVIVLIIFGAGKLPQIGGAIGKGIREFRKAQRGDDDEEKTSQSEVRQSKDELPQKDVSHTREH